MVYIENPNEIKPQIVQHFKDRSIVPIIGSGFTRGCSAHSGKVPSGKDYSEYMLERIKATNELSEYEYTKLTTKPFPDISEAYHELVSKSDQRTYLRDNFSRVSITEKEKLDFLEINWPYIYTFNSDDGIENNCAYNCVILPQHEVNPQIYDENKCVIKLHGDVYEILKYFDDATEVFDTRQYVQSISDKRGLLSKLQNDFWYNNIIFVGCGLEDELDILSLKLASTNGNNIYYCYVGSIEKLQEIRLKKQGVTHFVKFETFSAIYTFFTSAYSESLKIQIDDLERHTYHSFLTENQGYEKNMPYLLKGKALTRSNGSIVFPYHYIGRNICSQIIVKMKSTPVIILSGNGCSGKTYLALELLKEIRNKTVYYFESKENLSFTAFSDLISKCNAVFVFDYNSISNSQMEVLLKNASQFQKNNSNTVIVVSKDDRDLPSLIKLLTYRGQIDESLYYQFSTNNKFSPREIEDINPRLAKSSIPILKAERTIVDNILNLSNNLTVQNKYTKVSPQTKDVRHVACLIMLTVKTKLYTEQAVAFDIANELEEEIAICKPMIEKEYTLASEKSSSQNSPQKYVLNATYWLDNILSSYGTTHEDSIINAFKYIVQKCVEIEGKPLLSYGDRNALYKEYILFDTINRIFARQAKNLDLIRKIYFSLNDDIATDPHYLHQRAKCLIRSAYYESNEAQIYNFLVNAYHDAETASSIFESRYSISNNEKVAISLAHAKYSSALCLCHICRIHSYSSQEENAKAIHALKDSLSSPCIQYSDVKKDTYYNYKDVVKEIIGKAMVDPTLFDISRRDISELFEMIRRINA